MSVATALSVGFYGKIPSNGDFVSRYLSADTQALLEDWVGQAMTASRDQLGETWLPTFLTSPIWRFALPAGVLSENAYKGIYIPSVDKVGRYYPMILCQPTTSSPLELYCAEQEWYTKAEDALLPVLDDGDTLEEYISRVETLSSIMNENFGHGQLMSMIEPDERSQEQCHEGALCLLELFDSEIVKEDSDFSPSQATFALSDQYFQSLLPNYSLWWAYGSDKIAPSLAVCDGLPKPERFAAMLDGQWSTWGWPEQNVMVVNHLNEMSK